MAMLPRDELKILGVGRKGGQIRFQEEREGGTAMACA